MNTPAEEEAIQRGIAQDPDNPELTEAMMAAMAPAATVLPPEIYAGLVRRRGPGWQARVGAALAKLVGARRD